MNDSARDSLEQDMDKKMLTLSKVRVAKEEYQFKIKDFQRNIRRLEREIKSQNDAAARLEAEIEQIQTELNNG